MVLNQEHINTLGNSRPELLTKSILESTLKQQHSTTGYNGRALHDPIAVGYALNVGVYETTELYVQIEKNGEYTQGMCVVDKRPFVNTKPNVKVVTNVNAQDFIDSFLKTISKKQ